MSNCCAGLCKWSETLGGSADHWLEICAEKIAFGSLANGPPGSTYLTAYQARDDLKSYFAGLAQDWEMMEYEVDHFVAQGDRVVMLGRCAWKYRRPARRYGHRRRTPDSSRTARRSSTTSSTIPRTCSRRSRSDTIRKGLPGLRVRRFSRHEYFSRRCDGRHRRQAGAAAARCRSYGYRHVTIGREGERAGGPRCARGRGRCL